MAQFLQTNTFEQIHICGTRAYKHDTVLLLIWHSENEQKQGVGYLRKLSSLLFVMRPFTGALCYAQVGCSQHRLTCAA